MKKSNSNSKAKIIIIIVGALIVLSTVGTLSFGKSAKPSTSKPTLEPTSEPTIVEPIREAEMPFDPLWEYDGEWY